MDFNLVEEVVASCFKRRGDRLIKLFSRKGPLPLNVLPALCYPCSLPTRSLWVHAVSPGLEAQGIQQVPNAHFN